MTQVIETAPEMHLTPQDIENLLGEVEAYYAIYDPLFQRREQREKSQNYLYGLLTPEIENKAIEPMMLALKGDDQNEIRAMQHFISEGAWEDVEILRHHWREVAEDSTFQELKEVLLVRMPDADGAVFGCCHDQLDRLGEVCAKERPESQKASLVLASLIALPAPEHRKLLAGEIEGFKMGKDWRVEEEAIQKWLNSISNQNKITKRDKILNNFMKDGFIKTLPVHMQKRRYIYEYFLEQIELGRKYT